MTSPIRALFLPSMLGSGLLGLALTARVSAQSQSGFEFAPAHPPRS
jgi:hypothetical protein